MNIQQASRNATKIKNELITEIEASGYVETDRIIAKVSNCPLEVAKLMNYCHKIDKKYGSSTALELIIELEVRYR